MFGSDGVVTIDMTKAQYKTKITGNQYVVETALPFKDLKPGREIGFAMQVNDITKGTSESGNASGTQTPDDNMFKLIAQEVVYPEPEVVEEIAAPVEVADAGAPAQAAPVVTTSAQTSDSFAPVIFAVTALCAAAFIVCRSKRIFIK